MHILNNHKSWTAFYVVIYMLSSRGAVGEGKGHREKSAVGGGGFGALGKGLVL